MLQRDYTPPEADAESARRLFDTLGIERIVVIQASIFGLDNRDQLEEGAKIGLPMRAVVVVSPDASDAEMRALHDQGARGIRFIMAHPGGLDPAGIERAAARASEMGWHLQFLLKPDHLVELEPRLQRLPCPVVIDHMGFLAPEHGVDQPGVSRLAVASFRLGRVGSSCQARTASRATGQAIRNSSPIRTRCLQLGLIESCGGVIGRMSG